VPDPVSWFLVERGWKVVGSDGAELGTVEEALGDENADIFDGLAVSIGLLDKPRYVPAEQVGEILVGEVHLTIEKAAFDGLGASQGSPRAERVDPE
jgi:hypothetical protein